MLAELKNANAYIYSKINEKDEIIIEMEKYAKENNVPIVTKEVAEYLRFLVETYKSKRILEIGTAIGYSGAIIAKAAIKNQGSLTTIEISEDSYNIAKKNFAKLNLSNVKQILGDAKEKILQLDEEYDFIFIDAAKGQYKYFFDEAYKLLKKDGIILIDNIMFRGYVYQDEYPKRYKTLVKKLNEFINYLYENHNFVLLPFGDGIGLVNKQI